MIQIIGSVLLFVTCTALGFGAGSRLKERVKELNLLVTALEEMERELQCRLTPIPELLTALSSRMDGPVGAFFHLCVSGLNGLGERSFSSLWREALEAADLRLEEEDKVLFGPCSTLHIPREHGRFDKENFDQIDAELEEYLRRCLGDNFIQLVNGFREHCFFAVSALGCNPTGNTLPRGVSPMRVEDPFIWLLNREDQ